MRELLEFEHKMDPKKAHRRAGGRAEAARSRVAELRDEVDELRQSKQRLIEACEEYEAITESWCETFSMELTDGGWTWKPFWDAHNKLVDAYQHLVRQWNRYIAAAHPGRNVGRPLAASQAQIEEVQRLRRFGVMDVGSNEFPTSLSLRQIAEQTSLSLATVRTVVAQANRTDRTTLKHLARIMPDKAQIARDKRQRRTGNVLPKRINAALAEGRKAVKEARR